MPKRLKRDLPEFEVRTVREHGWASRLDGDLVRAADAEFDAFVTVDRRLVHEQNLSGLRIAVVILVAYNNSITALQPLVPELRQVLAGVEPGQVVYVPASGG